MARLQILELPEGSGDDRPPFVLVIDQAPRDEASSAFRRDLDQNNIAAGIGARHVLVFEDTIDIPANDTTAYLEAARSGLPADAHYETVIDGTPVEWTRVDELNARATEGLRLAHERTNITRDMYRLAKRRNELANALGMKPACNWDDIVNAARGLRKERDTRTAIVQRIRDFPNTPESADSPAGTAPEYLAGYRDAVDAVRRATYSANAHTDA
jgi:hypothetical protein